MQKIALFFLWIIAIISTIIIVTGFFVDKQYIKTKEFHLDYEIPYVWEVLTDFENIKDGKSDVKSVETIGKYYNLYSWKEILDNGGFRTYRQTGKKEGSELVLELSDSSYDVTGTWKFSLKEADNGTIVTIEENSIDNSIIRRGMLYYFDRGFETTTWSKYLRVRLFKKLLTTP